MNSNVAGERVFNVDYCSPELSGYSDRSSRNRFARVLQIANDMVGGLRGRSILDMGCGPANFVRFVDENNVFWGSFQGVDIRPSVIQRNRQEFPDLRFQTLDEWKQDTNNEHYDITRFDITLGLGIFGFKPFDEEGESYEYERTVFSDLWDATETLMIVVFPKKGYNDPTFLRYSGEDVLGFVSGVDHSGYLLDSYTFEHELFLGLIR